jgi:DNA-directed RNA polymerase specialized sigma24 family protein
MKIHMNRLAFQRELPLRPWVFTIASRTLTDHWRGLGRRTSRIDTDVVIDELGAASSDAARLEDRYECERLLAHLGHALVVFPLSFALLAVDARLRVRRAASVG